MRPVRTLLMGAVVAQGLAACGDAGHGEAGRDGGVVAGEDAAGEGAAACFDPCVAKGASAEECALFCGGSGPKSADGTKPQDTGETLSPLPLDGAPGTFSLSFEHDGVVREAIVYVPTSYSEAVAAPLLLNLHGFGGTAQDHIAWADMRPLADEAGFLLVYPQGSLLDGQPHWNSATPSHDNKSAADDFGYMGELLDRLASSHAIDADRVYAAGYSNGAMMAFGLACYLGERIAAVASVSGAMLDDVGVACTPPHATSVITLHGTADAVLPYEGGDETRSAQAVVAYWTDFNGITGEAATGSTRHDGTMVESFLYEGGRSGTAVHHYRVVGGEHLWFELEVGGSDTNRLIWDFVSRFGRDGAL